MRRLKTLILDSKLRELLLEIPSMLLLSFSESTLSSAILSSSPLRSLVSLVKLKRVHMYSLH